MTPDTVFQGANAAGLLSWTYLIAAGRWTPRTFCVVRYLVPMAYAVLYVVCLLSSDPPEEAGFDSLAAVTALFTQPWAVVAGWIHYLAFDFFVGCWILGTARRESIPHWLVIVPLILTFMFGPAGLLLFLILRFGISKRRSAAQTSNP